MDPAFFFPDDWSRIARIALLSLLVYASIVILVRLAGKRVTAKRNAFDWIVTIALGSVAASVILTQELTFLEGMTAVGTLVALQYLVTWSAVRWHVVEELVAAAPCLLVYRGEFLDETLQRERVTRDEILAAVRQAGHAGFGEILAVILEPSAELSIVTYGNSDDLSALVDVGGMEKYLDESGQGTDLREG